MLRPAGAACQGQHVFTPFPLTDWNFFRVRPFQPRFVWRHRPNWPPPGRWDKLPSAAGVSMRIAFLSYVLACLVLVAALLCPINPAIAQECRTAGTVARTKVVGGDTAAIKHW